MPSGLNMRWLTKSAKRMPDNVDTTYAPTMNIYFPPSISHCNIQDAGGHYLVIVLPLFAKLECRAQVPEVSRYVTQAVIWLVRIVVADGKYYKHFCCAEGWKGNFTVRDRTHAKGYLSDWPFDLPKDPRDSSRLVGCLPPWSSKSGMISPREGELYCVHVQNRLSRFQEKQRGRPSSKRQY
jgi:hypothetical protein